MQGVARIVPWNEILQYALDSAMPGALPILDVGAASRPGSWSQSANMQQVKCGPDRRRNDHNKAT